MIILYHLLVDSKHTRKTVPIYSTVRVFWKKSKGREH